MDKVWTILNWCFAVLLIVFSLGMFASSIPAGLIMLLTALLITPLVADKLKDKFKVPFGFWLKTMIFVVGFIVSFSIDGNQMTKDKLANADQLFEQAITSLSQGEIDKASNLINEAKLLYPNKKTNKATELEDQITKSESVDYAFEQLISMTDDEYNLLLQGNLGKQYFEIKYLNDQFLALMKQESPKRAQYFAEQKKLEEQRLTEQKKQEEQQRIAAEQQRIAAEQETRKQKIESQFSPWDGAHYNLTKIIKASMNDPSSFKHVETVYLDMKDYLVVKTTFRGTNAFGGVVTNAVKAKVSLDGEVLEIIE